MSTSSLPTQTFGFSWPDLNESLFYNDVVKSSDSELTLIETKAQLRCKGKIIIVDGEVVRDPNTILSVVSELVYHRLPWREPDVLYLLEVLYEDGDMIALNNPGGLQVLPGGLFQQRTVLAQLLRRETQKIHHLACQELHPVPVHRLGRGTSGILLCAKTKHAKTQLAAYFADGTSQIGDDSDTNTKLHTTRKISKIYRALVTGILYQDEVMIKQPIGIVRYPGVAKGLYIASPTGKPALSKVQVLKRDIQKNHTIIQVEIQSGRPHQIRIHVSCIGHPLLGDPLYVGGGQPKFLGSDYADESFADDGGFKRPMKHVPGDCGYTLHAHQVVLSHPSSNEVSKITAPLPLVLRTQVEVEELGQQHYKC